MSQKILIIGGTRYFGRHFVRAALKAGAQVTIVSRGLTPDPFSNQVQRMQFDRVNEQQMSEALGRSEWDVVVDQNCYSAIEAEQACRLFANRVGRYVHTSTQSTYLKEGEAFESDFDPYTYPIQMLSRNQTDYGEAKRGAEAVFFQQATFPVAAVRYSIVLGSDDYTGRLEFHLNRVKENKAIVIGNRQSRVSVTDSIEAGNFLYFMSQSDFTGPVNACSQDSMTIEEIVGFIESTLKTKAQIQDAGLDADRTPFAGVISRYMNSNLSQKLGFQFSSSRIWLPRLIEEMSRV